MFVFAPGSGLDTIFDFEQGKDLMDVRDYGAQSVADLTIATSGGHSIVDLDGAIQTVSSSDFIFA